MTAVASTAAGTAMPDNGQAMETATVRISVPGRGAVQARVAATSAAAVVMPKPRASRTDGTPPKVRRS